MLVDPVYLIYRRWAEMRTVFVSPNGDVFYDTVQKKNWYTNQITCTKQKSKTKIDLQKVFRPNSIL